MLLKALGDLSDATLEIEEKFTDELHLFFQYLGRKVIENVDLEQPLNAVFYQQAGGVIDEYWKEYDDILSTYIDKGAEIGLVYYDILLNASKDQAKGEALKGKRQYKNINVNISDVRQRDTLFKPNSEVSFRLRRYKFQASEHTKNRVNDEIGNLLSKGYRDGWGPRDVADQLKNKFTQLSTYESRRIAQTEINTARNFVQYNKLQEDEMEYKIWHSASDSRTRLTHRNRKGGVGGEIVPINERFSNGLLYPGDKDGPIEEWINCRCSHAAFIIPEGYRAPDFFPFKEKDLVPVDGPVTPPTPTPKPEPKPPEPKAPKKPKKPKGKAKPKTPKDNPWGTEPPELPPTHQTAGITPELANHFNKDFYTLVKSMASTTGSVELKPVYEMMKKRYKKIVKNKYEFDKLMETAIVATDTSLYPSRDPDKHVNILGRNFGYINIKKLRKPRKVVKKPKDKPKPKAKPPSKPKPKKPKAPKPEPKKPKPKEPVTQKQFEKDLYLLISDLRIEKPNIGTFNGESFAKLYDDLKSQYKGKVDKGEFDLLFSTTILGLGLKLKKATPPYKSRVVVIDGVAYDGVEIKGIRNPEPLDSKQMEKLQKKINKDVYDILKKEVDKYGNKRGISFKNVYHTIRDKYKSEVIDPVQFEELLLNSLKETGARPYGIPRNTPTNMKLISMLSKKHFKGYAYIDPQNLTKPSNKKPKEDKKPKAGKNGFVDGVTDLNGRRLLSESEKQSMSIKELAEYHGVQYEGLVSDPYRDDGEYHYFHEISDNGEILNYYISDNLLKELESNYRRGRRLSGSRYAIHPHELLDVAFRTPKALKRQTNELMFRSDEYGNHGDKLGKNVGGYNRYSSGDHPNHRIVINPKYFNGTWSQYKWEARDWMMTIYHEFTHSIDDNIDNRYQYGARRDKKISAREDGRYRKVHEENNYFTWYGNGNEDNGLHYALSENFAEHGGYVARMLSLPENERTAKIEIEVPNTPQYPVPRNARKKTIRLTWEEYKKQYPDHYYFFKNLLLGNYNGSLDTL